MKQELTETKKTPAPARSGAEWLPVELLLLRHYAQSGITWALGQQLLAMRLQRTAKAVARQAETLGIEPTGNELMSQAQSETILKSQFTRIPEEEL